MRPDRVGLHGADSGRPVLESLNPHDAVAVLMDAVRHRDDVAVGDVLSVGVKLASPLTLVVPFKSAVEPGAEVKARGGHWIDPVRGFGPVLEHCANRPTEQATIVVSELQVGDNVPKGFGSPVRKLDRPASAASGPARSAVSLVVDEEGKRSAVGPGHGHRHPHEHPRRL